MVVCYKGGSQYVCNFLHQQNGAEECQRLRAAAIDAAVAAAFLEAVAPAESRSLGAGPPSATHGRQGNAARRSPTT
ncbi:hypothetical protein J2852_006350 [Azospirillum soli]|nr:hypothetical protein [Azospirillum soli]